MSLIVRAVTRPNQLYWWQWFKIFGLFLPLAFLLLGVEHRLLWAVAVHFFLDFTAQAHETALGKERGDKRVVAYHAFISGGYTGLVVGGLPALAISIPIHFLIDTTKKFGITTPAGPVLDQTAHIFTLIAIWWLLNLQ
jgi:hypothetical protein